MKVKFAERGTSAADRLKRKTSGERSRFSKCAAFPDVFRIFVFYDRVSFLLFNRTKVADFFRQRSWIDVDGIDF